MKVDGNVCACLGDRHRRSVRRVRPSRRPACRVTLGSDLHPLIPDAVHSCGCNQLFLPTERVQLLRRQVGFEEPIAAPQQLASATRQLMIRAQSATHYVQTVYPAEPSSAGRGLDGAAPFRRPEPFRTALQAAGNPRLSRCRGIRSLKTLMTNHHLVNVYILSKYN